MDDRRITSHEELAALGGQVIKYSCNGGQKWSYTRVSEDQSPYTPNTGLLDVPVRGDERCVLTDAEVTPEGSHYSWPFPAGWFTAPNIIVEKTAPEEIEGKQFSYDFTRRR